MVVNGIEREVDDSQGEEEYRQRFGRHEEHGRPDSDLLGERLHLISSAARSVLPKRRAEPKSLSRLIERMIILDVPNQLGVRELVVVDDIQLPCQGYPSLGVI